MKLAAKNRKIMAPMGAELKLPAVNVKKKAHIPEKRTFCIFFRPMEVTPVN
jgi:hypothetical protein